MNKGMTIGDLIAKLTLIRDDFPVLVWEHDAEDYVPVIDIRYENDEVKLLTGYEE
jgi:hypothetical protein